MNKKEELYYLLNEVANNNYTMQNFVSEFTRIFELEIDYDDLTDDEYKCFEKISMMSSRFSSIPEDLKLTNVYFSKSQIMDEISLVLKKLKNHKE